MRALVRTLAFAACALLIVPQPLNAHGGLRSSVPAKDAHLETAPRDLVLTFTEPSPLAVTRIRLVAADSAVVELGPLTHIDGDTLKVVRAEIPGRMAKGTYVVEWQTAGADGHPVRGSFAFMVMNNPPAVPAAAAGGGGAAEAATGAAQGAEPMQGTGGFDAEAPAYVIIRWFTFMALVALLGVVSFEYAVLRRLPAGADAVVSADVRRSAQGSALRIGQWAVVTLALATVARLAAQAYALFGAEALDLRQLWVLIGSTGWGRAWLLQVAGVLVVLRALSDARRARANAWWLLAAGVFALAVTPALSGHAMSVTQGAIVGVVADTVHVIAAGGWIGTLTLVLVAGIPAMSALPEGDRELGVVAVVQAFSPVALVCAGGLAVSGVFAAWAHLGTLSALWRSAYGLTLVVKLSLLSVVALTGWYNWKRVTPTLNTASGVVRLRRTAAIEVAVAVAVLLATAVLVATPTPMD